MTDKLGVYIHDTLVGEICRLPGGRIYFDIDEGYSLNSERYTLSQSFVEQDGGGGVVYDEVATTAGQVPRFFSNLMPEGHLRKYIADKAGISEHREFELLELLGSDLPGAVTVKLLEQGGSAEALIMSHRHDPSLDLLRFSLAGVHLKFSAVKTLDRGLTIPAHGVGGDWIIKLPPTRYKGVPQNEFSVLSMAERVGITIPEIHLTPMSEIGGLPPEVTDLEEEDALVVKRFDRVDSRRVHIEDFAQAMGQRPYDKYAPTVNYTDVAELIKNASGEDDVIDFSRRLMFNAIVGNGDMHLKNWSFIYPDRRTAELAPAYDFLCTTAYIPNDRMALTLGSTRKWNELTLDDFSAVAEGAGVDPKTFVDAAVDTAVQFRDCWEDSVKSLPIDRKLKRSIEHQMTICPAIKAALRKTVPTSPSRTPGLARD